MKGSFPYSVLPRIVAWASALWAGTAYGLELPAIFGDNMVLQQGIRIPVWGFAEAGQEVTCHLDKQRKSALTDSTGVWRLNFDPLEAGGPYTLEAQAGHETIRFRNVLVGEVWLLAGQSNMQMVLKGTLGSEKAIRESTNPRLRLFGNDFAFSRFPLRHCKGSWEESSSRTASGFSAVGYYFGQKLQKELNVPVGLIQACWGGTLAECWMSPQMFEADEETQAALRYNEKTEGEQSPAFQKVVRGLVAWQAELHNTPGAVFNDQDTTEDDWTRPAFPDSSWRNVALPNGFRTLLGKNTNGAVRFRKAITIPDHCAGRDLLITYGPVKDFDTLYYNGVKIGSTDHSVPGYWDRVREYTIPGKLVTSGKAVLALRVFSSWGEGGFTGVADQMRILPNPYELTGSLPLHGTWKMAVERTLDPAKIKGPDWSRAPRRYSDELKHLASGLFNGMIHPLHPYALRGVLWYQGEGNGWRAYNYRFLLKSLVAGWHQLWGQGEFPFGIAQLANNGPKQHYQPDGGEMFWAQYTAHREIPNSGLIVTLDLMSPEIDTVDTTHYRNKRPVGERFCLWALAKAYGRDVEYSGPEYASMTTSGREIALSFDHVGKGLVSNNATARTVALTGKLSADCGLPPIEEPVGPDAQVRAKLACVAAAYTRDTEKLSQRVEMRGFTQANLRAMFSGAENLLKAGKVAEAGKAADKLAALLGITYPPTEAAKSPSLPSYFALRSRLDAIQAKLKGGSSKGLETALAEAERALEQDAQQLDGFAIAGEDRQFVPAKAAIREDKVVVWAQEVSAPRAVRYAWARNPYADLFNRDGLPASAFRTDNWPWLSEPRTPK